MARNKGSRGPKQRSISNVKRFRRRRVKDATIVGIEVGSLPEDAVLALQTALRRIALEPDLGMFFSILPPDPNRHRGLRTWEVKVVDRQR